MDTERIIRALSGATVLLSLGLGLPASPLFVSSAFLWAAAYAGFSLFQAAFTDFFPSEIVLRALGVKASRDID